MPQYPDTIPVLLRDIVPILLRDIVPILLRDIVPILLRDIVPILLRDIVPILLRDTLTGNPRSGRDGLAGGQAVQVSRIDMDESTEKTLFFNAKAQSRKGFLTLEFLFGWHR